LIAKVMFNFFFFFWLFFVFFKLNSGSKNKLLEFQPLYVLNIFFLKLLSQSVSEESTTISPNKQLQSKHRATVGLPMRVSVFLRRWKLKSLSRPRLRAVSDGEQQCLTSPPESQPLPLPLSLSGAWNKSYAEN
jgi:hypothetical protein